MFGGSFYYYYFYFFQEYAAPFTLKLFLKMMRLF